MVRNLLHKVKFYIQLIMTYQEKKSLVNLVSAILVSGIYYWYVFRDNPGADMNTDELLKFWGKTIIIGIPIAIIARIVIHIIFGISNTIITKENIPGTDERDKMIELKTKYVGQMVFGLSFVLAMVFLAMDKSVNLMFIAIIGGGIMSEVIENLLQLRYYRRGF